MAGIPPPYPMLTCEGFQLNGRCFSFRGIRRVSVSRLRELFHPECLRLDRDQRAAVEEGRKLFSPAVFVAQLRHYDIQFPASSTATGVRLHDAVMQGQCDDVLESIASLESDMRQEREADACRWEEAKRAWHEEQKNEAFRNARTATERATCDVSRFMNHYFFTDGNPDPSKTPEPLRLRSFVNHHAVHAAAAKVPGLQTLSKGTGTLVMSWDRRKVFGSRVLENSALKTQEKVTKATSERAVMEHRVLIAQEERGQEGRKPKTKSFKLAACAGSYVVRCKDIYGNRPPFTMDITVPTVGRYVTAAAFDFGIMKGTMLLSLSEDALSAVLKGREPYVTDKWFPPGHEKDDSVDDSDDDSEEDDFDSHTSVPRKRKASSSLHASRQAKKVTTTKTNDVSHRVYFKFRGREEGE
ncbi:hypothetical protein F5X68DRAFT_187925 [Plectosphaerella plurivora]|uniref:Uncharacterized protein n=1 Tax=Plectosphaerella plurivora TaxID=936078 RepID=A0A9P9AES0_9PEZI|nr:hypothetical protein F5X68DRAFT_187925 [Plectosphaerella plurivora]